MDYETAAPPKGSQLLCELWLWCAQKHLSAELHLAAAQHHWAKIQDGGWRLSVVMLVGVLCKWVRTYCRATGGKWHHSDDTLTSFDSYQTLQVWFCKARAGVENYPQKKSKLRRILKGSLQVRVALHTDDQIPLLNRKQGYTGVFHSTTWRVSTMAKGHCLIPLNAKPCRAATASAQRIPNHGKQQARTFSNLGMLQKTPELISNSRNA